MNAKSFAAGLILLFFAWAVNQFSIPLPGVGYWEPVPGWRIPVPTINYVNPLGWLAFPLSFIGGVLIILGLTSKDWLRIVLMVAFAIAVIYFKGIPFWLLSAG